MLKNISTRRIIYWIFGLVSLYLILIIWWKHIQTLSSFPWFQYNIQEFTWYVKEELDFEEINIKTKSWENINWLYIDNNSDKTVYYFHWNWLSLSFFYSEIRYIKNLGYNVMAYDYPWYWKSTWVPHYSKVAEFSDIFFNYVKKEKNLKNDDIIVWGYSIWTAVAVDFISRNSFDRLVLVSPLASRYDMAKKMLGYPIQKLLFIPNSFVTKETIKNIKNPTLIIHWNNDKIVPFDQWKLVFKNSSSNEKYFIELDNWWHNYIINSYWKSLKRTIKSFLKDRELEYTYLFLDNAKKQELFEESLIFDSDLDLDNSLTKYVSNKISFNDLSYVPENLESISSDFIYDAKWWIQKLKKEARIALDKMSQDFYKEFDKKIVVVSAYRSYLYQKWIKDRWCPDNLCAKAWFSEHQSGLAVDFWEASTKERFLSQENLKKYYEWLTINAHKYGFHNTYTKWLEIDWYDIEPWHWRYLWIPLSTYLNEKNLNFWEFYNLYNKIY